MTSPDIMRFGVTSTTPATRRRNLLGEDRKSGVAHTGKVAGRLLADVAFRYDAAGRLVKEGDKTYRYGYLDKVLSVTEGERTYTYDYHVDGQLARANYDRSRCHETMCFVLCPVAHIALRAVGLSFRERM